MRCPVRLITPSLMPVAMLRLVQAEWLLLGLQQGMLSRAMRCKLCAGCKAQTCIVPMCLKQSLLHRGAKRPGSSVQTLSCKTAGLQLENPVHHLMRRLVFEDGVVPDK